jgi:hypothetical protein
VARMPRACARRNCRQRGPSRRGIDTSSLENRPHPTCRDLVAKPGEFAVDASIPPGRVLGGQPQHQPAQLRSNRGGRRFGDGGVESSVASPDPGATVRSWPE